MSHHLFSLETLESRRLLSGTYLGSLGTLRVFGDNGVDDSIAVSLAGDQIQVVINGGAAQNYSNSAVLRIIIRVGSGNDAVDVTGISKPTWVYGEAGNDSITTGGEKDMIYSGDDDDVINAGDGPNYVVGGEGNDNITTGNGRDRIWGRGGNDVINSGGQNDVVIGGLGDDIIDTGSGSDRAYGRGGNDHITGGPGNDRLWGGPGDDVIDGGTGDDLLGGILGNNQLTGGQGKDTFVVTSLDANIPNDFDPAVDILRTVDPNVEDLAAD